MLSRWCRILIGAAALGVGAALPALWGSADLLRPLLLLASGPALFWAVREALLYCAAEPYLTPLWLRSRPAQHVVLIPVDGPLSASSPELACARTEGTPDVRALYVERDAGRTSAFQQAWACEGCVPLVILERCSWSRVLTVLRYVESLRREPDDVITLVVPAHSPEWPAPLRLGVSLFTQGRVLVAPAAIAREGFGTAP
jgi:hypothetical protein